LKENRPLGKVVKPNNGKEKRKMALPLSLQARIMRTILNFAAEHKMKEEVVQKILKDINEDQILSELGLDTTTKVYAKIDHHSESKDTRYADLLLYVGPRDFQWQMKDGELVGAGTCLE
jgi:signal recognition particle GTPase